MCEDSQEQPFFFTRFSKFSILLEYTMNEEIRQSEKCRLDRDPKHLVALSILGKAILIILEGAFIINVQYRYCILSNQPNHRT